MWYNLRKDGQLITLGQAIRLSKTVNGSIGHFRQENTFVDVMRGVLNYARAFREDYVVCFVQAPITNTLADMTSSSFLAASSWVTYERHVRLAKLMNLQRAVLPLLQKLSEGRLVSITLGVTHLDHPALSNFEYENVLHLIEAADLFYLSRTTRSPLRSTQVRSTDTHGPSCLSCTAHAPHLAERAPILSSRSGKKHDTANTVSIPFPPLFVSGGNAPFRI